MTDLALLSKTEIIAKTPYGQATVVIAKTEDGYSCALWGGDQSDPTFLGSKKFSKNVGFIEKAQIIGALLEQAKAHVRATAERYPDGLDITIRVEHAGRIHSVDGKLPLDKNKLAQFAALIDWVKQVNAVVNKR